MNGSARNRVSVPTDFSQVELSVGRPPDPTWIGNVHQVDHVPNGPTNSAAITTMFLLRLGGGKPLVAVTRERRYGPSRLRVNDDDDDDDFSTRLLSAFGSCLHFGI